MTNPQNDQPEAWGYIDKRNRACEAGIWMGVEPCYSEDKARPGLRN